MALYGELKRLLESEDNPLSKRQKLAENAFYFDELPIFRKEDFILNWLCNQVPKQPNFWSTLENCLKSLNSEADFKLKPENKELLIDSILKELQNDSSNVTEQALGCCRSILTSSTIQRHLKNNVKQLSSLLVTLFNFTAKTPGNSNGTSTLAFDCALCAVQVFAQMSKQQTGKTLFAETFVNELLYPLANIVDCKNADVTNKLGAETHKCIQNLVFSKSNLPRYKESSENELILFSALRKQAPTASVENNVAVFTLLARAMVGSYRSDVEAVDFVFRKLAAAAGKQKLKIFNVLLDCMTEVAFDFDHVVEEATLTQFLEKIVDEIVARKKLSSTDYDTLCNIANLNPLIIEKKNQDILGRILLEKCTDEAKSSHGKLMGQILNVTLRLRHEQQFVIWISTALKRSLENAQDFKVENIDFLGSELLKKFADSMGNMSSKQTINVFRTLLHRLKTDCVDIVNDEFSNTVTVMLKTIVELTVAFFQGVRIFEHTVLLDYQVKFVSSLVELREMLSPSLDKALKAGYNSSVTNSLLQIALVWNKVLDLMLFYSPKAVFGEIRFPFSKDQLKQLKRRIDSFEDTNCRDKINKLFMYQMKSNYLNKESIKVKKLASEFQSCWSVLIEDYPDLIPLLNDSQVRELALFVLEDMMICSENYEKWIRSFQREILQENRVFMTAITTHVFTYLQSNMKPCVTKTLLERLTNDLELKGEEMIKVFEDGKWIEMKEKHGHKLNRYLEILQSLKIAFFATNVKKIIFLVVYSICREFHENKTLLDLCGSLISNLFQESEISIPEYVEPLALLTISDQPTKFSKVIEISLKNPSFVKGLEKFIAEEPYNKERSIVLLKCVEKASTKVNQDQKRALRELLKTIMSNVLKNSQTPITHPDELMVLAMALKTAMVKGKIKKRLSKPVRAALETLFVSNDSNPIPESKSDRLRMTAGLNLAALSLKCKVLLKLNDDIPKLVWKSTLKQPEPTIFESLMPFVEKSELMLLQKEMIEVILKNEEEHLKCFVAIWESIMKIHIAKKRQGIFLEVIHSIFRAVLYSNISQNCWPHIMKLTKLVIGAGKFDAAGLTVDLSILVGMKYLRDTKISACHDILILCSLLINHRTDFVKDRLASFIKLYAEATKVIIDESRNPKSSVGERQFCVLMLEIEKITIALIKLRKDVARLNPYLLSDFIEWYSQGAVPSYVKESLGTTIAHIFSTCDQHAIAFLSRCLPVATQEVFKTFHASYRKFHKFTGKI